ncbi:hypothetical protein [Pseudomonas rhizosphaerae]|jgi:hypothetical protein|uniref:hypothetical protein n=1 Tax=Pseudomonas rhizosphaerae TaxID=216142 RepID=UPI002B4A4DF0|nr:hypothetical protein [Pseudomonas rhizosphaerae]MEB2870248.1 hypothetical protein [Pseudomonas rhizosphaerae]
MSDLYKDLLVTDFNGDHDPEKSREAAVAAALKLIETRVLNASGANQLQWELNNLSGYADLIQDALKAE